MATLGIGSEIWYLRESWTHQDRSKEASARDRLCTDWIVGETSRSWIIASCKNADPKVARVEKIPKKGEGDIRTRPIVYGAITYYLSRQAAEDAIWKLDNQNRIRDEMMSVVNQGDVPTLRAVEALLSRLRVWESGLRKQPPGYIPPRYDDVFAEGTAALNAMDGRNHNE